LDEEARANGSDLSLASGFSPVLPSKTRENRFNGFPSTDKPLKLKRLAVTTAVTPG
jgi:hypothetical protein